MHYNLDLEHLRGWIGRERTVTERLTAGLVERFNATFDRRSPLDEGADAPPLIHFCLAQAVVPTSELGADGHPVRGGFLPPVPLPQRMWAGSGIRFHAPLRIGDTITRRTVIDDVTIKRGRSGALCFVTLVHHLNSGEVPALTERQVIVYREPGGATPLGPTLPVSLGHEQRRMTASAPLLLRYSALTFNGHRIHYDAPYARDEEHYPGLVVHGPLQATLLCQHATDLRGAVPASFRFRSRSPLFADREFSLMAESEDGVMRLRTVAMNGPDAMEAEATW